jgi:hypothetical protein
MGTRHLARFASRSTLNSASSFGGHRDLRCWAVSPDLAEHQHPLDPERKSRCYLTPASEVIGTCRVSPISSCEGEGSPYSGHPREVGCS